MNRTQLSEYVGGNEGIRYHAYNDSVGIRTIGYGFNLQQPGARQKIISMGLDYTAVFKDQAITEAQASFLLQDALSKAETGARGLFSNFNTLSNTRQIILTDMTYNMGRVGLSRFKKFKAAIEKEDFADASDQIRHTAYAKQVKSRATRNMDGLVTDVLHFGKKSSSQPKPPGSHNKKKVPVLNGAEMYQLLKTLRTRHPIAFV